MLDLGAVSRLDDGADELLHLQLELGQLIGDVGGRRVDLVPRRLLFAGVLPAEDEIHRRQEEDDNGPA